MNKLFAFVILTALCTPLAAHAADGLPILGTITAGLASVAIPQYGAIALEMICRLFKTEKPYGILLGAAAVLRKAMDALEQAIVIGHQLADMLVQLDKVLDQIVPQRLKTPAPAEAAPVAQA